MFTRLDDWWYSVPLPGKAAVCVLAGAVLAGAGAVGYDRYCWREGVVDGVRTNPVVVISTSASAPPSAPAARVGDPGP